MLEDPGKINKQEVSSQKATKQDVMSSEDQILQWKYFTSLKIVIYTYR